MNEQEQDATLRMHLDTARSPTLDMRATRVIFEYGLDFIRQDGYRWTLVSAFPEESYVSPNRVMRETALRPVVAWHSNRDGGTSSFVLPQGFDFSSLDNAPVCITQIFDRHGPRLFPAFNHLYFIQAIAYRLRSLAIVYAWNARAARSEAACRSIEGFGSFEFRFNNAAAFEAEACLTTIVRMYEMLRFPIRERFAPGQCLRKKWGWDDLIDGLKDCPDDVHRFLKSAKSIVETIRQYRHYVEHVGPIAGRCPVAQAIGFPGIGYGASVLLPDDPTARELKDIRRDAATDALTYCWSAAVTAIDIGRRILTMCSSAEYDYPDEVG